MDKKRVMKWCCYFFACMIMITILARIINNVSLPTVTVEEVSSGTIRHEITGTADIEGRQDAPVFVEEGLCVKHVKVVCGEQVKKEDVLFEVDLEKLEDSIIQKERELEISKMQLHDIKESNAKEKETNRVNRNNAEETYQQTEKQEKKAVEEAKKELETAKKNYSMYIKEQDFDEQNEQGESVSGDTAQDEEVQELLSAISAAQQKYDAAVIQKENAILLAKQTLEAAEVENAENTSEQQQEIHCREVEEKLNILKEIKENNGEIRSTVEGIVTKIGILSGDVTSSNSVIIISDTSEGLLAKAIFSIDYEREIYEGQTLILDKTIQNGSDILQNEFVIDKVYKSAEDNEIIVQTVLSNDTGYKVGNSVSVQISVPKKEYSCIVPLAALNQNESGKYYVNTLIDKETILGTQKMVLPIEVELLDKDADFAAIEGIQEGEEIVVNTTKSLTNGSRVKYSESVSD